MLNAIIIMNKLLECKYLDSRA